MTGEEMARSYWRTAELILQEAENALQQNAWHLAVRRSQESVEMALGQPPEQIFSQYDGEQAVTQARFVLDQCRRLIAEYNGDDYGA